MDLLFGGTGNDSLYGGDKNDALNGGDGVDSLFGGSGSDVMRGGAGGDFLQGDDGNDVMHGEEGDDLLNAGNGHDSAYGGAADDEIHLFDGNDYAVGGSGEDSVYGGNGNDRIYDTSGPIFTYDRIVDLGGGPLSVKAFAPGQAKLFQVIDGQLQVFDTAAETYVGTGTAAGAKVNAIGLNIQDDLIYGYAKSTGQDALGNAITSNSLVMMDATGSIYRLGTGDQGDFVGDFDCEGNLWTFHTTLDRVTKIDVDTLDADGNPAIESFDFPTDLSVSNMYDVAYNPLNSLFYGVVAPGSIGGQGKILMIDLVDVESGGVPVISEIPITHTDVDGMLKDGMPNGAFGAVFMDGVGNLYAGLNNGDHDLSSDTPASGGVYRLAFDDNGRYATAVLMSSTQSTGNNDGAMDTRGNDPFAEIDATANVLITNIAVVEAEGDGWDDLLFGGEGRDTVHGGGRNDYINGGLGDDLLFGEAGTDTVFGLNGDDVLFGGSAGDTLHGGIGNDKAHGGHGNDTLFGEDGRDTLNGDSGNDIINGGDGDDVLSGGNDHDTLSGGLADDTLQGAQGNDVFDGNEGSDVLFGDEGKDTLFGSEGTDSHFGGSGNDVLKVGGATDTLDGGAGNDALNGDLGNDILDGGNGNDTLAGGEGGDHLSGDAGTDDLFGGSGSDSISGGSGNDEIFGGSDDDILHGDGDKDHINGEAGADAIHAGSGSDTVSGGDGNDIIEAGAGRNVISGGDGADTFVFLSGNGAHHDAITDYQIYGEKADAPDLSDFLILDTFGSLDTWQSGHVSIQADASLNLKLGYGQSLNVLAEVDFTQSNLDAFYDTILL